MLPTTTLRRYGLVALAFLHIGVGRGLHGTFGVFFVAMLDTFGWSRAVTAGAISLAIIFEGACLPFVGGLIDRIGGRKTLIGGGLVLAVGLSLASTISSIWQFYFWIGIVSAAGIALIGMVPHVAIITREFPQRRGTALGIAWAGGGVGIVLLVPATQLMISNWGWSAAYVGLAVITAMLVIPPVPLFLPASTSAARKEAPTPNVQAEKQLETDWTVKRALANRAFWLLFIARTLASMGNQIIVTHQIAHAIDVGYAKVFAASIFGLMGVISIGGRIMFGYLADVMKREVVFTWVQIISSVGILALLGMHDASMPWLLYLYAVCYGLGQGSRALVLSAISADIFHGKHFGAIFGYFTFSIGLGGATGAWLGGFLFDITHSYAVSFWASLACLVISVFIVLAGSRIVKAQKSIEA
ncbi:MAG: MFS transporter [Deltaproteobacteria bacterium]|nr:MFS transporter [Deltaproteobacteria bacterium]MDZ4344747.1 MFS transporter [Candidatus Binatia bacterium]